MQTDTDPGRRLRALTLVTVLAVFVALAGGCSDRQSSEPEQSQPDEMSAMQPAEPEAAAPAPEAAVAPAAEPEPAVDADAAVASAADGESIYNRVCKSCHAAGIANAPKVGDAEAWAPRIAKGKEALFESVKNGLNVMPPRGACAACSDEELRSALEYMIANGS